MRNAEHQLYEKIARYLQTQYPGVIYRFDLAADLKLTPGQAAKHKRLHPDRGYPDLFIASPRKLKADRVWAKNGWACGLYLEIKAEGNSPFKKDGTLKKDDHLVEQMAMICALLKRGYKADFAVGFEDCKKKIDEYLGGDNGKH